MKQTLHSRHPAFPKTESEHSNALPTLSNTQGLSGNVGRLKGNAHGVTGNAADVEGDFDACGLSDEERAAGVDITALVDTAAEAAPPAVNDTEALKLTLAAVETENSKLRKDLADAKEAITIAGQYAIDTDTKLQAAQDTIAAMGKERDATAVADAKPALDSSGEKP